MNGEILRRQSQFESVAKNLKMPIKFPNGRRLFGVGRGWDDAGGSVEELARFDQMSGGKESVLIGYSNGAGLAMTLGVERSKQVRCVIAYAGRLRVPLTCERKWPIMILWNENDGFLANYRNDIEKFKAAGHRAELNIIDNNWSHMGKWDARENKKIEAFIRAS
jgi:dienelactone hydrolase